jgi:hypothetical protein
LLPSFQRCQLQPTTATPHPTRSAFELIAKHRSIPAVLAAIDKTKNVPHEGFEEVYKEAALFFKEPEVRVLGGVLWCFLRF